MDGRPGPVRDAVASVMREWLAVLKVVIEDAVGRGELRPDVDPAALSFRLNALGMAANWQRQLFGDVAGVDYARSACTPSCSGAHRAPPADASGGRVFPTGTGMAATGVATMVAIG